MSSPKRVGFIISERRRKMKKGYFILMVSLISIVAMTACDTGDKPTEDKLQYNWPKSINITSPSKGPKYYAPLAFAGVLEEKTGMKVRITPEEVGAQRLNSFRRKEFEIFAEGSGGPLFFMEGRDEYAAKGSGPLPITIMWPATIEPFAPMLRGDTEYKTIKDLKPGLTFAVPPGIAPRANCYGVAAWAGLKDNEWSMVEFGSMNAAIKAIPDGKADTVWWIPDAGETFEAETTPKGLHWLDLDPKADPARAEQALDKCPNWMFGKAPDTSVKSAKDKKVVLVPTYLYVLEDLDEDLVYNMCKFIHENHASIMEKHASTATMSLDSFKSILGAGFIPLHTGTIKFLKEKGIWTSADDKRQTYNKNLFNRYIEAFGAAVAEADKKKIKATPNNEEWLNVWAKHKRDIPRLKVMLEIP